MRRNVSICWSSAKSRNSARDHDSTIANTDSGALARANAHVAERSPVDLRLLARIGLDAQVRLARARWPHLCDVAAQLRDAELKTAGDQLLVQAHACQRG